MKVPKLSPKKTPSHLYLLPLYLLIIFLFGISAVYFIVAIPKISQFMQDSVSIINPLMGWAPWATADDIRQPHSLVYADLTWREFEPQKGRYDFNRFEKENHLKEWGDKGVRVVFRFVLDVPRDEAHLDIPDWLYEKTGGNGDHYTVEYGKGYSPKYSDPNLIDAHQNAIRALGEKYGQDDFFAYIQLGSLGHWGEWHVKSDSNIRPLPGQEIRDQYVTHYLEAFPNTHLLMRRPFAIAKTANLGLYNDMTGDPKATYRWLEWIEKGGEYSQTGEEEALSAMPDGWQFAPIGGEQTGSRSDEELYGERLDRTLGLLRDSHTTFIGPGGPYDILPGSSLQNGLDAVLATMGYRFYVSELRMPDLVLVGKKLNGKVEISNAGIAPIYYPWPLWFYVVDEKGEVQSRSSRGESLMGILPDQSERFSFSLPIGHLERGVYYLGVGVVDPITGKPAIRFGMQNTRDDAIQILKQFEVKSFSDILNTLFTDR